MSSFDATAAATTLRQLGGYGRLKAMISIHNILHGNEGRDLMFKFRGSRKANHCKVELTQADTYTVTFTKIRGYDFTEVATFEGVYADQLRSIFESVTGLYLSL